MLGRDHDNMQGHGCFTESHDMRPLACLGYRLLGWEQINAALDPQRSKERVPSSVL